MALVLVAGATGFLGRNVVQGLLDAGHKVRAIARNPSEEDKAFLRAFHCQWTEAEINDKEALKGCAEDCEAVINLVGILRESHGNTFEQVHVEGTANLLEEAKAAKVKRFIYVSALGTDISSKLPYWRTKAMAEELIINSRMDYVIFRPSFMIGKRGQFTNEMTDLVRKFPVIPVPSLGKKKIQPVDVRDVAKLIVASVSLAKARNKTFEVGGPERINMKEFCQLIANILDKRRLVIQIPILLMRLLAPFTRLMPGPAVTQQQLTMLSKGSIADNKAVEEAFEIKLTTIGQAVKETLTS